MSAVPMPIMVRQPTFIQKQNLGMPNKCSSDGNSLLYRIHQYTSIADGNNAYLLATRESRSALVTAFCFESIGQRFDELELRPGVSTVKQDGSESLTILASLHACSSSSSVT